MRSLGLLLVALATFVPAPARAEVTLPADVVVVWAPNLDRTPLAAAARDLGIAVIDRTPAPSASVAIAPTIRAGIEAYDALHFDDAWAALERARELVDRTGAAGLTTAELSDLFLYRALVQAQREPDAAWDELVVASVVDPTRVLDRTRFPPKVIEQLERARLQILAAPRVHLAIDAPATCTARLDGHAIEPALLQLAGPHWLELRCPDRAPWGTRVTLADPMPPIHPTLVEIVPPTDAELVTAARSAGARGLFVVEVRGAVATVRVLALDGRERARRTVAVTTDLAPVAAAMRALAEPTHADVRWYRRNWVWAVGGAAVAAAIAIPFTFALVHDSGASNTGALHWSGVLP